MFVARARTFEPFIGATMRRICVHVRRRQRLLLKRNFHHHRNRNDILRVRVSVR